MTDEYMRGCLRAVEDIPLDADRARSIKMGYILGANVVWEFIATHCKADANADPFAPTYYGFSRTDYLEAFGMQDGAPLISLHYYGTENIGPYLLTTEQIEAMAEEYSRTHIGRTEPYTDGYTAVADLYLHLSDHRTLMQHGYTLAQLVALRFILQHIPPQDGRYLGHTLHEIKIHTDTM